MIDTGSENSSSGTKIRIVATRKLFSKKFQNMHNVEIWKGKFDRPNVNK